MSENIGGYSASDFSESSGNAILKQLLEEDKTIKTRFAEADKSPNYDDFFELLEKSPTKYIPTARTNVQIKTLERDYINHNKREKTEYLYKYQCDTKVFNAVKRSISLDPTVLFLVDIKQRKVFWIYLSDEYVFDQNIGDNKTTTVYFSKGNLLSNIDSFVKTMKSISEEKRKESKEVSKNQLLTSTVDTETIELLQMQFDQINFLFDNELMFIREGWFRDAWKFGIAYSKKFGYTTVAIYIIRRGEQGTYYREFIDGDDYESVISFKDGTNDINGAIHKLVNGFIHSFFNKSFVDPSILTTVILEEIAFTFLDLVPRICKDYEKEGYPCVYYKDEESMANLIRIWDSMMEVAFEFANAEGIRLLDPIVMLASCNSSILAYVEKFRFYASDPNFRRSTFPFDIILKGAFSYNLFIQTIAELKKRSVKSVKRVWKHEDYLHFSDDLHGLTGLDRIETGFMIADYNSNIHKFFAEIGPCYLEVAQKLFGKSNEKFMLLGKIYFAYSNDPTFCYVQIVEKGERFEIIDNNDYKRLEMIADKFQEEGKKCFCDPISASSGNLYDFRDGLYLYNGLTNLLYLSVCKHLGVKKETHYFMDF